jgi:LemA protein
MSLASMLFWGVAAVLLFWTVGAYNRLVRLRNHLLRRFVPVDQQLAVRSTLLQRQLDALAALPSGATREVEELRAARAQADAAWEVARHRPGASGAINSLRLALQILARARERLALQPDASAELTGLHGELVVCDHALQFALGQFNDAVNEYNLAVRQFPTGLLAAVFQFRGAVPL